MILGCGMGRCEDVIEVFARETKHTENRLEGQAQILRMYWSAYAGQRDDDDNDKDDDNTDDDDNDGDTDSH